MDQKTSLGPIFREGYLHKCGKTRLQGYKKRWFVLNQTNVKYYSTQDPSENNILGTIDMAEVVSISNSKNVKHGFQVSTSSRTYYLSAKTAQEKDEWISVMEKSNMEAKRLSALSSGSSLSSEGANKLDHEYSLVGAYSGSQALSSPSSSVYDTVSSKSSEGDIPNQDENIYETFEEPRHQLTATTSWKEPINSGTGSRNGTNLKMGQIMSKLSMESLDSIDSLELSDSEYMDELVDMEGSQIDAPPGEFLPKPHGKLYAIEEIKKFLEAEGYQNAKLDFQAISDNYKVSLDNETEYPAFDALSKFLKII